jgi:hypothetical protein
MAACRRSVAVFEVRGWDSNDLSLASCGSETDRQHEVRPDNLRSTIHASSRFPLDQGSHFTMIDQR